MDAFNTLQNGLMRAVPSLVDLQGCHHFTTPTIGPVDYS
jgi:hypothetical protein